MSKDIAKRLSPDFDAQSASGNETATGIYNLPVARNYKEGSKLFDAEMGSVRTGWGKGTRYTGNAKFIAAAKNPR